MLWKLILLLIWILRLRSTSSFTKVLVPAVYREWVHKVPEWMTDTSIQQRYNFSTFLYQKLDPNAPNYIAYNRGTEAGVYFRYIVDHYDNFPDVAIFVHGVPEDHQKNWLEMIGCISPNATYANINLQNMCRNTHNWWKIETWVEQCWRDVLRVTWELEGDQSEFNKRVPVDRPITVCFVCCQQFLISREWIHRRPLSVWKKLLRIIGEQSVCHIGEPDYANLYAKTNIGPEQPNIVEAEEGEHRPGYGAHTQGGAMEHLAHVVFGHYGLDMDWPGQEVLCQNFLPKCPGSPCLG